MGTHHEVGGGDGRAGGGGVCRDYYDPSTDRRDLYTLPRRARFWPGSDQLQGEQWQRVYGDIALPQQLQLPRRRPSCLQDELRLNSQLRLSMQQQQQQLEEFGQQLKARRGLRATSVGPEPQATNRNARFETQRNDSYEISNEQRLEKLRAAKATLISEADCLLTKERVAAKEASRYLKSVKLSTEEHHINRVNEYKQEREHTSERSMEHVPRWAVNHPIQEPSTYRPPPPGSVWPERRPFYDLKNDYNAMLSFVGVNRE